MSRSRNFCYTLNNYNQHDFQTIQMINCKYTILAKEIGEEKKTPHLQGYINYKNSKTLKAVIKQFQRLLNHKKTHIEICKGNAKQNIEYCKKQDDYIEIGDCPNIQGARTDLARIRDRLKDGEKPFDIIDTTDTLNYQSLRGLELLAPLYQAKRTEKPLVIWVYGTTGLGKTRMI